MPKARVFVDTNIVIEACRISVWKAVTSHFAVETVDRCVAEAQTGPYGLAPGLLGSTLSQCHAVTETERQGLTLVEESVAVLDDGEKDLFARIYADGGLGTAIILATADKAALVAANNLGWLDQVRSLEDLAKQAGASPQMLSRLEGQFCERWLSQVRTMIALGQMP